MPNQRAKGQILLPFAVKEEFIQQLDKALDNLGISNRSEFIRQAILEKLETMGKTLPSKLAAAPARVGKGGPEKKITSYRLDQKAHKRKLNSKSDVSDLADAADPESEA